MPTVEQEFDSRMRVLRTYIIDREERGHYVGGDKTSSSYISNCLSAAMKAWMDLRDSKDGIIRIVKTKLDFQEFGTSMGTAMATFSHNGARVPLVQISPPIVETSDLELYAVCQKDGDLEGWMSKRLWEPFASLENTVLAGKKEIWLLNGAKVYYDMIAEFVRFKMWETCFVP